MYAIDGKCHNAEPGTYGHECGKPAVWVGEKVGGFRCGYCAKCRSSGYEARGVVSWQPYNRSHEIALKINRSHTDERGFIDEPAMVGIFNTWNVPLGERLAIWRSLTAHWAEAAL